MAHTPGPWTIIPTQDGESDHILGDNGDSIVCTTHHPSMGRSIVNTADAYLIAAAPDLLAACEAALSLMPTGEYTPNQEAKQEALIVRKQLRAAIAKATP